MTLGSGMVNASKRYRRVPSVSMGVRRVRTREFLTRGCLKGSFCLRARIDIVPNRFSLQVNSITCYPNQST